MADDGVDAYLKACSDYAAARESAMELRSFFLPIAQRIERDWRTIKVFNHQGLETPIDFIAPAMGADIDALTWQTLDEAVRRLNAAHAARAWARRLYQEVPEGPRLRVPLPPD